MIGIFSGALLLAGAAAVFIGSAGLIRLPDSFSRFHGAGVVDTLGAWLVLTGLLILSGSVVVGFKILLIMVLLYFLSPVSAHGLADAASRAEWPPSKPNRVNEAGR